MKVDLFSSHTTETRARHVRYIRIGSSEPHVPIADQSEPHVRYPNHAEPRATARTGSEPVPRDKNLSNNGELKVPG